MSKKQASSPLESAKVSKEAPRKSGWGGKGKGAKNDAEATTPKTNTAEDDPDVKDEPAAKEAPAAPGARPSRFKVTERINVSMDGFVTTLNKGTIISSQHYGGMPGIEKLKREGVEMEQLED